MKALIMTALIAFGILGGATVAAAAPIDPIPPMVVDPIPPM